MRNLLVLSALLVPCVLASAQPGGLQGCWRNTRTTLYFLDGRTQVNAQGNCQLQFMADRISTRCRGSQAETVIEYSYAIIRPGVYTATMLSNSSTRAQAQAQIGGTREYQYRMEAGQLFLTTFPQTTKPAPTNAIQRVESVSKEEPCQGGLLP